MPVPGELFKNKLIARALAHATGLLNFKENSQVSDFGLTNSAFFKCCTGSLSIPDATPGQAANIELLADGSVPPGMRCYLTRVSFTMLGAVNWSNTSPTTGAIPYLALQDSAGCPAVSAPFTSLKGLAHYNYPEADLLIPLLLGPNTVTGPAGTPVTTFTYVQSTGVITAGATSFVAGVGVGSTARVVDGTGKGQSAFLTATTATTATVAPAFVGLDATSVIAIDVQGVQTYTDTTHLTLFNGAGTPFTANVLDNGFGVIGVQGAGAGQDRNIVANTTAGALTLQFALDSALTASTAQVMVRTNDSLGGTSDCCVSGILPTMTPSRGLQLAVNNQAGTSPLGSAVRVYAEGFFAL